MGTTKFSESMLTYLLMNNFKIETIFTIPEEFYISYSSRKIKNYNYANLKYVAKKHKINIYEVESTSKKITNYYEVIKKIGPDVILVLGWYYMVPKIIRDLAKYGTWGIHASLLPKYAGGAPLVWAIINGERETGVTLFKLDDGVDDGDIIAQKSFSIEFKDTIKEVYQKAIKASKEILIEALNNIDKIKFKPQDKSKIEVYPQRKPEDGKIDLTKTVMEIYNFIRAQTKPYPGAYTSINGERFTIWNASFSKYIPGDDLKIGEIVLSDDKGLINFKNGLLEIKEVCYGQQDWRFNELAQKKGWGGGMIGT